MGTVTLWCLSVTLVCFAGALAQENTTEQFSEERYDGEADVIDYSHYYANTSLWNTPVGCYDFEIDCLQRNMIYYEPFGQCVELHAEVAGCSVVVERGALERAGRLRAACYNGPVCPDGARPMAYDGRCPGHLRCRAGYAMRRHPFGGAECACATDKCGPGGVAQPQFPLAPKDEFKRQRPLKDGYRWKDVKNIEVKRQFKCRFPDFQMAQKSTLIALRLRGPFTCDLPQKECIGSQKVALNGACFALLSQGSCPDGEWVVLDKMAAMQNRQMKAMCRPHSTPCEHGWTDAFGDTTCVKEQIEPPVQLRIDAGSCFW